MDCRNRENQNEQMSEPITRQERLSELMLQTTRMLNHSLGGRCSQGRVLRILNRHGSMTQQELQSRLNIQPSSTSEILTKLENAGFITRKRDETDRRRFIIAITEAGRTDVHEHWLARRRRQSVLYDVLDSEEQEEMIRLLEKLRASWEAIPIDRRIGCAFPCDANPGAREVDETCD